MQGDLQCWQGGADCLAYSSGDRDCGHGNDGLLACGRNDPWGGGGDDCRGDHFCGGDCCDCDSSCACLCHCQHRGEAGVQSAFRLHGYFDDDDSVIQRPHKLTPESRADVVGGSFAHSIGLFQEVIGASGPNVAVKSNHST